MQERGSNVNCCVRSEFVQSYNTLTNSVRTLIQLKIVRSGFPRGVHFRENVLVFPLWRQHKVHQNTSFCTAYLRLHNYLYTMILQSQYFAGSLEILLEFGSFLYRLLSTSVNQIEVD